MKQLSLENEFYRLQINLLGAELKSVYSKTLNQEILYSGKEKWWGRSAPVLFPIVGRLKNDQYTFEGKQFELSQHGFARDSEFEIVQQSETQVIFSLRSNKKSLLLYPFDFELQISYELKGKDIFTNYLVKNKGIQTLFYSIGAHPAFLCPLFENEAFEDYVLEFEQEETFERHLIDPSNGLFTGKTEITPSNNRIIKLNFALFEQDALVFKNLRSNTLRLRNKKSTYVLHVDFQNFPYLGIWTKPGAPFICIEPWLGLADSSNHDGNINKKEGIHSLEVGSETTIGFSFGVP